MSHNYLIHYGIKGQRWGIRRFQNPDGSFTSAGLKRYGRIVGNKEDVTVFEKKSRNLGSYEIYNKEQRIGKAMLDDYEDGHSHLDWLGINESQRRKGYGSKALDAIIDDCIKRGRKYITLDAAGLDPAARHVYEKKGFYAIDSIDNDLWNGLIVMRKDL